MSSDTGWPSWESIRTFSYSVVQSLDALKIMFRCWRIFRLMMRVIVLIEVWVDSGNLVEGSRLRLVEILFCRSSKVFLFFVSFLNIFSLRIFEFWIWSEKSRWTAIFGSEILLFPWPEWISGKFWLLLSKMTLSALVNSPWGLRVPEPLVCAVLLSRSLF